MRHSVIIVCVLAIFPFQPAWADASTHDLQLTAVAAQGERVGAGRRDRSCTVRGRLRSIEKASGPVAVSFWFLGHPGVDEETETAVSFQFPALAEGALSDWVRSDVHGIDCESVRPHRVEVRCLAPCGFVHVQVPDFPTLQLRQQRVTALPVF